jgi:hypothetical protein
MGDMDPDILVATLLFPSTRHVFLRAFFGRSPLGSEKKVDCEGSMAFPLLYTIGDPDYAGLCMLLVSLYDYFYPLLPGSVRGKASPSAPVSTRRATTMISALSARHHTPTIIQISYHPMHARIPIHRHIGTHCACAQLLLGNPSLPSGSPFYHCSSQFGKYGAFLWIKKKSTC